MDKPQTILQIPLDKIQPNPEQPRKEFDKGALEELAESIREHGVLQPILVEAIKGERFQLQAGERRWRAARLAGLAEIPAILRPPLNGTGPRERLVIALVENLQRADMNAIDEAQAYKALSEDHGLSQVEIGHQVGVPFSRVHHLLTVLKLQPPLHKYIADGRLSHDPRVVAELLAMAPKEQVQLGTGLANRRVGPKVALEVIGRFKAAQKETGIDADDIPARKMAFHVAGRPNKAQWDALAQVGRVPPWLLVEVAARDTCNGCALREQASPSVCKGCSMVDFLTQIIGSVSHGGK
jgi:ParB/RepB/Spo0J family partition protein